MADSDDEGNLIVDDGNNTVDDSICPICKGSTYVGETISCEICTYWFHFECVGVKPTDQCVVREDVPFFCSKCKSGSSSKKSKPKKAAVPKKAKTPKVKPVKPMKQPQVTSPPIKLKISFGKKKVAQRSIELSPPRQIPNKRRSLAESLVKSEDEEEEIEENDFSNEMSKKRKRKNSEEEEEKWLDAVESGNLHAVDDELKSIRDPKTMTARQRAIVDRKTNDEYNDDVSHMSLAYIKKPKLESEEDAKIKALKSAKRKEIEAEKREQDRIKTMERLLNKRETLSKTIKNLVNPDSKPMQQNQSPKITYIENEKSISLSFPKGMAIPIPTLKPIKPPDKIQCFIKNCKNVKKYNCSQTGKPLCSLACYKKNLMIKG